MSDLLSWAPSQPTPIKVILSLIALALFAGALAIIWISPTPKNAGVDTAVPASPDQASVTTSGSSAAVSGVNNGIVAGVYNAAPSSGRAQEELAQEQLAEVRRQRSEAQADRRQRNLQEKQVSIRQRVEQLRHEYMLSQDGLSPALLAGLETPPDDWMNERLAHLGEPYTFKGLGGGRYEITPRT